MQDLDAKMIPSDRISEFLSTAEQRYGPEVRLAFRVGMNAMLRVTELAGLNVTHFRPEALPLPQLAVAALKKKSEVLHPVDLNPDTIYALTIHLRQRNGDYIFSPSARSLQRYFQHTARALNLGHLSIHALRHTGIWNRARSITNLNDLNYLRQQARHSSIETTQLYLGYEAKERVEMAKRINWV